MRPTFVLLLAAVALVGATGAVAADGGQHQVGVQNQTDGANQTETANQTDGVDQTGGQNQTEGKNRTNETGQNQSETELSIQDQPGQNQPHWPGEDTTTENNTTTTGVSPGQQLAGAVGAQGASLQGELWNRTLSERLTNATTADERADVVSDEVESLESYLDALETVRGNITERWEDDEISEGQYRASLSEFVVRARTVELRANQTARAAERLPLAVRERHDINVTYIRNLGEDAHALYQFENETAQEVANETLANQSMEELPIGDEQEDDEKRSDEER